MNIAGGKKHSAIVNSWTALVHVQAQGVLKTTTGFCVCIERNVIASAPARATATTLIR